MQKITIKQNRLKKIGTPACQGEVRDSMSLLLYPLTNKGQSGIGGAPWGRNSLAKSSMAQMTFHPTNISLS